MATYYAKLDGTVVCDANRVKIGVDDTNFTRMPKGNFIYCTQLGYNGKDTEPSTYKLQWRVSGGVFADVASTGEIKFGATVLTNGTVVSGPFGGENTARCTAQAGETWQEGYEVEGTATSSSINLGNDCYTEIQWSLSCADATPGAVYEFQVYGTAETKVISVEGGSMATIQITNQLTVNDATSASPMEAVVLQVAAPAAVPLTGVPDSVSASSSEAVVLAQKHQLIVPDSVSASSAEAVALAQKHQLAVADSVSASPMESPVPAVLITLTVADSASSSTLEAVILAQKHRVAPADATSAAPMEAVALTQRHSLAVADATSASVMEATSTSLKSTLVLASMASAAVLEAAGPFVQFTTITPADSTSASTAEAVVLSQHNRLSVNDSVSAAGLEAVPAMPVQGALGVVDATSLSSCESPALLQHHRLAVLDATSSCGMGLAAPSATVKLTMQDSTSTGAIKSTTLKQHNVQFGVTSLSGSSIESPSLTQHHRLQVGDLASTSSLEAPVISYGLPVTLTVDDSRSTSSAESPVLVVPAIALTVADMVSVALLEQTVSAVDTTTAGWARLVGRKAEILLDKRIPVLFIEGRMADLSLHTRLPEVSIKGKRRRT